jgi:hypothetical protein
LHDARVEKDDANEKDGEPLLESEASAKELSRKVIEQPKERDGIREIHDGAHERVRNSVVEQNIADESGGTTTKVAIVGELMS